MIICRLSIAQNQLQFKFDRPTKIKLLISFGRKSDSGQRGSAFIKEMYVLLDFSQQFQGLPERNLQKKNGNMSIEES